MPYPLKYKIIGVDGENLVQNETLKGEIIKRDGEDEGDSQPVTQRTTIVDGQFKNPCYLYRNF
jgi:hypothetical protein